MVARVFTVHAKHYLACVYLLFVFKAWMGFAWQGCTNSTENRTELWEWPAPLDGIDYGEPVGLCTEVEAGCLCGSGLNLLLRWIATALLVLLRLSDAC